MILLLTIILVYCYYYVPRKNYNESEYFLQTKCDYSIMMSDKGRYGEYMIYKYLENLQGEKRFLFNSYIPKQDGGTTEIDIILIHESGIYVIESKNYSGWIFGSEEQTNWTQVLRAGKGKTYKNHFLNPTIQNSNHIKHLKSFLNDYEIPIFSCVVFSDHCELKEINLSSNKNTVINKRNVLNYIKDNAEKQKAFLSTNYIESLYKKLYPTTQVTESVKQEHIRAIKGINEDISVIFNNLSDTGKRKLLNYARELQNYENNYKKQ